ncbi:ribosomal protein S20 [Denitrovibrio acetiphilus DSM 12809]|uniref:Small ribosomal subunit protein bS20 n=1 Tax=Denitrovibrio acetiphilus (strain DSM 12809 / NBRC 114555 / N2460) TaxID=522772 RepID=D4H8V0_DENA2|nr:30S ribosomal protein S20 [Denitrovibrio acetiphilus]ADD68449.1 ribosomal protein S20 [Denitrovibrio acetiphilus DSM 12809]
MAHTLSANKRIRQSEKKKLRNKAYKSKMRTVVKKFYTAADTNDVETAEKAYMEAVKIVSKVGQKGVIHESQASRRVSRLTLKLNAVKSA